SSVDGGAVGSRRVVHRDYGVEANRPIVEGESLERGLPLRRTGSILIEELVNVDPNHALSIAPGLLEFVLDPLTPGSGTSDQDDVARFARHLSVYPCLDGTVAASGHVFPLV